MPISWVRCATLYESTAYRPTHREDQRQEREEHQLQRREPLRVDRLAQELLRRPQLVHRKLRVESGHGADEQWTEYLGRQPAADGHLHRTKRPAVDLLGSLVRCDVELMPRRFWSHHAVGGHVSNHANDFPTHTSVVGEQTVPDRPVRVEVPSETLVDHRHLGPVQGVARREPPSCHQLQTERAQVARRDEAEGGELDLLGSELRLCVATEAGFPWPVEWKKGGDARVLHRRDAAKLLDQALVEDAQVLAAPLTALRHRQAEGHHPAAVEARCRPGGGRRVPAR